MFRSFVWAGFECATGLNARGEWIDQVSATGHDRFLEDDYARVAGLGMWTVREGVRWPLVDRNGRMDFSTVTPVLAAARRHRIEVIFDLFHFGYPHGVDLFSEAAADRFAEYCYAVARYVARNSDGPFAFTSVNEPSFFSWAAGEAGLFAPHAIGRGWELKVALVRLAIRGIDAIRSACPAARIVNVDPICRVVAPCDRPECEQEVRAFNDGAVFQAYDMLAGRLLPELGGSPRHLGVVGINYYWTNQWEHERPGAPLGDDDPRRCSLGDIVRGVWRRYGADVAVTETSHVDARRAPWLREAAAEAAAALDDGVPLRGLCLYPVLGMPEWHDRGRWTNMGIWDVDARDGALERNVYTPLVEALAEAHRRFEHHPALAAAHAVG